MDLTKITQNFIFNILWGNVTMSVEDLQYLVYETDIIEEKLPAIHSRIETLAIINMYLRVDENRLIDYYDTNPTIEALLEFVNSENCIRKFKQVVHMRCLLVLAFIMTMALIIWKVWYG